MLKVNGKKINVRQLSDGSTKIPCLSLGNDSCNEIVITWHYEDNSEIFVLCTVMRSLLEFAKVIKKTNTFFVLEMPYMPYLKSTDGKRTSFIMELRTLTNIVNTLNFDEVRIFDPYSENAELLLNNLNISRATSGIHDAIRRIYNKRYGYYLLEGLRPLTMADLDFFFPDKKCYDKYSELFRIKNSPLGLYSHNRMIYRDGSKFVNKYGEQMEPWQMGTTNALIIDNMASSSEVNIVQTIKLLGNRYQKSIYAYASHTDNSVMDDNSELLNMYRNGVLAKLYTSDSLYSLPSTDSNNTGIDKYNMVEIIDY